ncbi:hypothetical protein GQ607_007464 [Colletotrichum asianum]|uniref:Uncharacterized protein n=1 Tax=Colletotrichum asianum TaxID=702518 RepID=A0A8H3WFM7_9PEZI|nr:hypothetical protein GQ607_007464 [Colletotrichum asianum]
MLTLFYIKK